MREPPSTFGEMAALLTSACNWPSGSRRLISAMATEVLSGSARSTWMWSSGPASHGHSSGKAWREQVMTRQPALENRLTVAWPMPRLAPVSSKVRRGVFGMGVSYGAAAPSRVEQRPAPGRRQRLAPEFQTVVQPKRAGTPELEGERDDAVSGPVGRTGNRADVEPGGVERHRFFERVAALERRGLLARPGADLGEPRAGREIGVRLSVVDDFDAAAQAHLAAERLPVKGERGSRVEAEFPPFLAVSIGVEHQTALVETLEQHHPHVRQPVRIDGRDRHCVGVDRLRSCRLLEPRREKREGIFRTPEITGHQ